jgi:hypothetical protein
VIHLRDLYPQVIGCRSDLQTGQAGWALVEASIRLTKDTFLLKDKTFGTLASGECTTTVSIPPSRELLRVEKVEYRDPADADAQWVKLRKTAKVFQEAARVAIDSLPTNSAPVEWSFDKTAIKFQAPSDADYPLRISYAWATKRYPEIVDLDVPDSGEDALVFYAQSKLLALAGKEQNIKGAIEALAAYRAKITGLKSLADTGQSGSRHVSDCLPWE